MPDLDRAAVVREAHREGARVRRRVSAAMESARSIAWQAGHFGLRAAGTRGEAV